MRQIELDMLRAIGANKAWSKDNTRVEPTDADGMLATRVFLHGNHIADTLQIDRHGRLQVFPNRDTLAQWPTPTTKSRLRALGVNVTQKAGAVAIDGEVVCHV
jgi:hypothetical protein